MQKKKDLFLVTTIATTISLIICIFLSLYFLNEKNKKITLLEQEKYDLDDKCAILEDINFGQVEEIEYLQNELELLLIENKEKIKNELSYIEPLKQLDKKEYLIQYKRIMENNNSINYETLEEAFTKEQINIMCRCIETEVFGAGFDARVNIASVILNRVYSPTFPSNPISVVTAQNQFAYGRTKISEDTKLALEYAFTIEDTTNGSIAFRSDCSPKKWGKWNYQFTDDVGHSFYK